MENGAWQMKLSLGMGHTCAMVWDHQNNKTESNNNIHSKSTINQHNKEKETKLNITSNQETNQIDENKFDNQKENDFEDYDTNSSSSTVKSKRDRILKC